METSRLRYDDGPSGPRRLTGWKTQRGPRLAGLLAGGLDAELQKRQEYPVPCSSMLGLKGTLRDPLCKKGRSHFVL